MVKGLHASRGSALVVDEDALRAANAVAREATGVAVSHTGSAGLAGLTRLRSEGVVKAGEQVGVIFSGVER